MELASTFMASWLTPSSLFLLLNLMIGTIFLTARLSARRSPHQHHDHDSPHLLVRRQSSLLDRVRSINFSLYKFDPPPGSETDRPAQLPRSPSLLQRLKSINLSSIRGSDPAPEGEGEGEGEHEHEHGVRRSKSEHARSDAHQAEAKAKAMKKSASERGLEMGEGSDDGEDEIAVERRGPATARVAAEEEKKMKKKKKKKKTKIGKSEGGEATAAASLGDERGVDEKADDFINRFKQQLRLQRLESLKRFSELLRGN